MKNILNKLKFRSISAINDDIRKLPSDNKENCEAYKQLVKEESRTWCYLLAAYLVFAAIFELIMHL
ncbi:MAG: hypothetical protein GY739_19295 [Mesoflavibacter sp.]|nr:hypothetical protein [Mesoflavibacter sp.]